LRDRQANFQHNTLHWNGKMASSATLSLAPTLTTERLVLRAHTIDDFEASHAMWSEPEVTRYFAGRSMTPNDSWMRVLRYAGSWALLGMGYWAVADRATGEFLGEAGLADLHRNITPSIDGIPESGWALCAKAHGRGLATEAMRAALDWADQHLSSDISCCIINPQNVPSVRVAMKLGYVEHGPAKFDNGEIVSLYNRTRC
jgi:RimJ/RimL family protein N-acetyltransferase